ncbi:MAG TPA: type II toxin-antitoxin system RelE/ParE family toxin [Planctomycetota bacterium]
MAGHVTWRRFAEEDLAEAYEHIGKDSSSAAERLLDAVERATALLLERPFAGRAREFRAKRAQGMRSWVVSGFESYLIFTVRLRTASRSFASCMARATSRVCSAMAPDKIHVLRRQAQGSPQRP